MRSLSWLASILLHLSIVVAALFFGTPTGVRVDLNAPVYQVELFSLSTEPPAPGAPGAPIKGEQPGANVPPPAEAKPIAAPEPAKSTPPPAPKPEPKPDLKAIAAKEAEEKKRLEDEKRKAEEDAKKKADEAKKKAEEEKKKAEEDKKRKAEEEKKQREQILKDALKAAADEAKKKEKGDAGSVKKELDDLRKQVGSGPAAVAGKTGSGAGGGGGPAGSTGTGYGSLDAYGRVVEQLIKSNWRFPSATAKNALVTQIEIRIAVDGSISGFRVLGTSGRQDYDASAVRAIQDTKQLPPPPNPDLSVLIINFNNQE
jgi:colicin import membrane protein